MIMGKKILPKQKPKKKNRKSQSIKGGILRKHTF